jgi:HK97 family phage portal protein
MSAQVLRLYRKGPAKKMGLLERTHRTTKVVGAQSRYLSKLNSIQKDMSRTGDLEEVDDHEFLDLMNDVSPALSKTSLWWLSELYMGLTGNCYWWLRPNQLGKPFQIWVLESQRTRPIAGDNIDEWVRGYEYKVGTKKIIFDPMFICHHSLPNPESMYVGASPVKAMSDATKILENINRYEHAIFKNMAQIGGVLETEQDLADIQYKRIRKEWRRVRSGVDNTGDTAILEGGLKFRETQFKPKDLGHEQGSKRTIAEIAAGHGIPLPLVTPERVSLAESKVAYAQYMRDTTSPKCRLYEEQINQDVVKPFFGEEFFCAFDNCVAADDEFLLRKRTANLGTGYTTINQERERDGEEPQAGWGDKPILSAGLVEFDPAAAALQAEQDAQRAHDLAMAQATKPTGAVAGTPPTPGTPGGEAATSPRETSRPKPATSTPGTGNDTVKPEDVQAVAEIVASKLYRMFKKGTVE